MAVNDITTSSGFDTGRWGYDPDIRRWQRPIDNIIEGSYTPTAREQFNLVSQNLFGRGYYDRPGMYAALNSVYQPLRGRFLTTPYQTDPFGPHGGVTFGDWLRGGWSDTTPTGDTIEYGAKDPRLEAPEEQRPYMTRDVSQYGRFAPNISAYTAMPDAATWRQVAEAARSLTPAALTDPRPVGPANPFLDILGGADKVAQDNAAALAALATFDPARGAMLGAARQRAMDRARIDWGFSNPGATNIDWLSYLTHDPRWEGQRWYSPGSPSVGTGTAAPPPLPQEDIMM